MENEHKADEFIEIIEQSVYSRIGLKDAIAFKPDGDGLAIHCAVFGKGDFAIYLDADEVAEFKKALAEKSK